MIFFRAIAGIPKAFLPFIVVLISSIMLVFSKRSARVIRQNVQKVYGLPITDCP